MNEQKLFIRINELVSEFLNDGFQFLEMKNTNNKDSEDTVYSVKIFKNNIYRVIRLNKKYLYLDRVVENEYIISIIDEVDSNLKTILNEKYIKLNNSDQIYNESEMDKEKIRIIRKQFTNQRNKDLGFK